MGRFGMGLPSASISQCKLVEVWSWQDGPDQALYTYIDLDKIERREQNEVPEPVRKAPPKLWQQAGGTFGRSGTLVVWSRLDRIMWRSAKAIVDNSGELIGRMYRRFLAGGRIDIRMVSFLLEDPEERHTEKSALANDPGYLIVPSSTPTPYNEQAMFQRYGERWEVPIRVLYRDAEHTVTVRFTYAKEDARSTDNAGSTAYGKHAGRNVGVSVVRAERELDLDQSWVISYDPTERWWGVEVEFPPALDELFGVTNNKQSARSFADLGNYDYDRLLRGRSIEDVKQEMAEEGDPAGPLIEVGSRIDRTLRPLRQALKAQSRNRRSRRDRRHPTDTPEGRGTAVTREHQQEGHRGASDSGEDLPADERQQTLTDELIESGIEPQQAEEQAAWTIDNGMKYLFVKAPLEGRTFFTVKPTAGEILIKINTNHSAYKHPVEVLDEDPPDSSEDGAAEYATRLTEASMGLKLLLMAWARLEDEQVSGSERERLQDIRTEWGRYAARFLDRPE